MSSKLKKSAEKVQSALNKFEFELNVVELWNSTCTAQKTADTISQIAKSLVFKSKTSQKPISVIASNSNRVNEKAIKEYIGEKPEKADSEDLMQYDEIWAAAGTPNAVFKLTPEILTKITKGTVIKLK